MASSVLLGTRPDWTRSTLGIPIETIVRIHPGSSPAKSDLAFSRNRVAVSRVPGAGSRPDDEFDVGYVYGPEATTEDVAARSLLPLLRKFVDGYNVAVMAFGATGSGKTSLLEGGGPRDHNTSEGGGLVHVMADEVFKLLAEKAAAVGTALNERRRGGPSARAFDFFIECSFVELYREEVYDMYGKAQPTRAPLPIYEDVTEGYQVAGLSYFIVRNSAELRTAFNQGRAARNAAREDVGPVHDRSAAIFSLHLAQFAPAAEPGEEDRVLVSKIQFVDLPGSERLAEDPEILRLREGPVLNRSLHALGATLRALAEGPGGGLAAAAAAAAAAAGGIGRFSLPPSTAAAIAGGGVGAPAGAAVVAGVPFIDYEASVLTKLLSDALGGNSLCLVLGTLRQCDGSSGLQPINTLQYLTLAQAARNFPVINHGRSRGLIQKLRYRLMAVVEDRQALRQLLEATPADSDPNSMALHLAKVRDLEGRLIAVRAENADLREEKQALQLRLEKLYQAEEGDLQEQQQLQDALIASEEQRLQLSRALLDFQMEFNEAKQEWETLRYQLEAKLIEAEARETEVATAAAEEVVGMRRERDELRAQLEELDDDEEPSPLPEGPLGDTEGDEDLPKEKRLSRAQQLKEKERRLAEVTEELRETRRELEALRKGVAERQLEVDEVRETYRRKLEVLMREVGERAAGAGGQGQTDGPAPTPKELFRALHHLAEENVRVTEARESDIRHDTDDTLARLVELRLKFKALYGAYRSLRQLVEDQWPPPGPPPEVPSPEQVLGEAAEAIIRSDEEADRRTIMKLRDQVSQMGGQLETLRFHKAARELGLSPGAVAVRQQQQQQQQPGTEAAPNSAAWQQAASPLAGAPAPVIIAAPAPAPALAPPVAPGAGGGGADNGAAASSAAAALEAENQRLRGQVETLTKQLQDAKAVKGGPLTVTAATNAVNEGIIRQLREFNQKITAELQRRAQQAETRATMAEEQLEQLQGYMNRASVSYQKEIVRLRAVVGQLETALGVPQGSYLNLNPVDGQAGGGGPGAPQAA